MIKRGAGILLINKGKVLLCKSGTESLHLDGTIAIPGGHIEEGETEQQAAQREFTEETGLVADQLIEFPGNYVEDKIVRKDGLVEYSFKVFLSTDYKGQLIKDSNEEQPFWSSIDEAKKMKLWANNNQLLERALKFLNS